MFNEDALPKLGDRPNLAGYAGITKRGYTDASPTHFLLGQSRPEIVVRGIKASSEIAHTHDG